ncbi:MAG: sigma-70 family RNA polymerase sigma factor [Pyrinomonadaceae bacterium]|nr:sigma-70 family RNA polymerase sigma factor [Pyrinomonadaceae bacterium]
MNEPDEKASEITQMLREWNGGKAEALDSLLPLVYDELHRQAARFMRKERAGHTLQTTALINEAYLKLIDRSDVKWESRTHFFAVAAQAMRRILVDYAKAKHREKRGGDNIKLSLEDAMSVEAQETGVDLLALDEALNKLAELDEQQARVVELKYFSGLSLEETAEALHVSRATAARDWEAARAWLHRELTK